jgi:hypothetical protein
MIKRTTVIDLEWQWMLETLISKCAHCQGELPREIKGDKIHITAWVHKHKLYCCKEHAQS